MEYITNKFHIHCVNISYGGDNNNNIEEFLDTELFTDEIREKYYNFSNKLHEFKLWLSE